MTATGRTAQQAIASRHFERLTLFSDAVFAIAMTLLVIEVRLPHLNAFTDRALRQALPAFVPDYIGFVVGVAVLARFWSAHHVVMGALKAASPRVSARQPCPAPYGRVHAVPHRDHQRIYPAASRPASMPGGW